jgi:hypothetical protein
MRVALLGNGNSRNCFTEPDGYDYLIGCNVPWRQVNSTVVLDVNVLEKFDKHVDLFVSRKAWIECSNKIKNKLIGSLRGLFDPLPEYDSTGHAACRKLLELGATEIHIYGCDSWFTNDTESYTHKYVDSRSMDMTKNVSVWRARWYELMAKHPQVVFNFIGEPK